MSSCWDCGIGTARWSGGGGGSGMNGGSRRDHGRRGILSHRHRRSDDNCVGSDLPPPGCVTATAAISNATLASKSSKSADDGRGRPTSRMTDGGGCEIRPILTVKGTGLGTYLTGIYVSRLI